MGELMGGGQILVPCHQEHIKTSSLDGLLMSPYPVS